MVGRDTQGGPGKRARSADRPTRTLTSDLFERLRTDILGGHLEPGSRLRFRELRARYATGLSPLREALMRLAAEDLVVLSDHKGFRVAPISKEEMVDVANTLFELEALALRKAIAKGDDRWEANIVARFHELSKREIFAADGTLDAEWEARNVAFHRSLYSASGSPSLMAVLRQLSERFSRYRRLWPRQAAKTRDVSKEHENIMRATVARDAERAVALLRDHRATTIKEILTRWDGR